jgi:hypothetical protein
VSSAEHCSPSPAPPRVCRRGRAQSSQY